MNELSGDVIVIAAGPVSLCAAMAAAQGGLRRIPI